jgi:hypothetical protein
MVNSHFQVVTRIHNDIAPVLGKLHVFPALNWDFEWNDMAPPAR